MKQRIMVFFVLLWLGGCGGGGGGSGTPAPPGNGGSGPVATPVGTPNGDAVSAVMGAEGGTLTSTDGGVTLEVPPGVFAEDTTVSIQSIHNHAHGGVGQAYRFSPDGLQTNTPMTLHFHLSDEELQGGAMRFASVAFQDSNGFWHVYNEPSQDTATQTVSVPTRHFSDWSAVMGVQLRPGAARVKTDGGVTLQVQYCEQEEEDGIVSLLSYCTASPLHAFSAKHWSVNGVEGGGADTGIIAPDADVSTGKAYFKAPHYVPGVNPVAVSVEVTDFDHPNDLTLLVSHVTIEQTLLCDSLKQVNTLNADILFNYFEWSASTAEESYDGHQFGHIASTLVNQIPVGGRDESPIGYWTSQGQPHSGYVSVDDTYVVHYPDGSSSTSRAQGGDNPYSAMDAPSYISLIVDYKTCVYQLVAAYVVGGTVTVDGVSANKPIGVGGIYYSETLPAEAIDTGTLERDVLLPAQYDPDTKINGYYPAGQNGELRAGGSTQGHWTITVAD